ncbi:RING-H2 zinc finger protein RHA1a-like [Panicum miliaceum]|uniref:RING-H2 zinc finger protein RHA1a-like n=1 Tax=Panicum miliaceum TaxID=4540 RepID=A0A3L6RSA2_PANMI|nr:RING-H2 zinc finger protein RHA1a-like [Panicum miliaceum]
MGFPLASYCLAVPKPVVVFCKLLSVIRDAFLLMLAVLGLCPFPYDDGSRRPAGGPKPEEVKSRLPAMEYGELVAERLVASPGGGGHAACQGEEAASPTCIVCLEKVEAADEVRRLGNCAHAFHRGCIDRWIDLGRATCPLCRSDLLPRPRGRARLGRLASLLTRVW